MLRFANKPFLKVLSDAGIEVDQRIRAALAKIGDDTFDDGRLFNALYRENCIATRYLQLDQENKGYTFDIGDKEWVDPDSVTMGTGTDTLSERLMNRAIKSATIPYTFGVRDFLRAVLAAAWEHGDTYSARPFTLDLLAERFSDDVSTPLSKLPEVKRLLRELQKTVDGAEDFQYVLALQQGRLVFRVVSTLDDYVQPNDTGLWLPQRALLTHLGGIGLFTSTEIEELEELLNDPKANEVHFQDFFERHPHFFRKWDYREVYPHVYLAREDHGPLVPDFIMTNPDAQDAAILDLKKARPKSGLIRRQRNRERFASAVEEARAQLLEYRDWFDVPDNRQRIKSVVGMEIYRPRLMVVIGRASEFRHEIERQKLRDRSSDIEIVTYDDIVRYAKARRVIIEGRNRNLVT